MKYSKSKLSNRWGGVWFSSVWSLRVFVKTIYGTPCGIKRASRRQAGNESVVKRKRVYTVKEGLVLTGNKKTQCVTKSIGTPIRPIWNGPGFDKTWVVRRYSTRRSTLLSIRLLMRSGTDDVKCGIHELSVCAWTTSWWNRFWAS